MQRVEVAWSKMPKGALGQSGDSIELVERPLGGLTLILADGQGSGPAARRISRMVAMRAVQLIADGSRDGAVARAVQDMLYTAREGRVTATLALLSVDWHTRTLVIARNAPSPVLCRQEEHVFRLEGGAEVIGTYRKTRPAMTELEALPGSLLLTCSDGLLHAGRRYGTPFDWTAWEERFLSISVDELGQFVDELMDHALDLERGRPTDDISIMALGLKGDDESARRSLYASIPY
ncbi:PP2C family protein-serine/threonine phosphatase [Sulfobacillus harzensis]|uniref:Serine/threonine-protein phosphatase n=1 Tax=Sulfobacillus harzensis TaxID=2729629 RepID=A0A7Y0L4Z1_9FIRM|nr:PP2C family protein-serine/threonine phosphatase [Sulfobacillus harzensis]NMP22515.1 serine/threonine-protein phosphatase [Sulfobacillus harzensis]